MTAKFGGFLPRRGRPPRETRAVLRLEVCIDCNEPERLVDFWAAALDYRVRADEDGRPTDEIEDPDGVYPSIWFQVVPENKTTKNRVHLDPLFPKHEIPDRVARLLALGGERLGEFPSFVVMADPEGNEFCLCWDEDEDDDA
jgi:hypothetical protein